MSTTTPARPDAFSLVTDSLVEGWRRMAHLMFLGPAARLRNWFVWGLIILMAGLLGGGGGPGANFEGKSDSTPLRHFLHDFDPSMWPLILAAVLLALILFVVMFYFQARFRLVFIEGVIVGEPRIRGVFRRTAEPGLAYFIFRVVTAFAAVVLIGAAVLVWAGALVALLVSGAELSPAQVLGLVLTVLLWVGPLAIVFSVLAWFVHHLVLPHVWLKRERFGPAFRTAWRLTWDNFGASLLFLFLQLIVRIAATVAMIVLVCCSCCIWLWPALVVVGLAVASAAAPIVLIATAPLMIVFVFLLMWLFATLLAPIPVFFRAWSLAFVAGMDPTLALASATPAPFVPQTGAVPEFPPPEPPPPESPPDPLPIDPYL